MPKRIRIFGKKRGDRHTVPRWMGPTGQIAFYLALLVCSSLACGYLLKDHVLPEWWANRHFVPSTCRVVQARVEERLIKDSRRYRPAVQIVYQVDSESRGPAWTYDARFAFEHDQATAQRLVDAFEVGGHYTCWYDPVNPANVILVRGLSLFPWLLISVPAVIAAYSAFCLVRVVTSTSLSAERLSQAHVPGRTGGGKREKSNAFEAGLIALPPLEDIVNSPGTHLTYRLPGNSASSWKAVGALVLAVLFNLTWILLLVGVIRSSQSVGALVGQIVFLLPLLAMGVFVAHRAVREWSNQTGWGTTRLEISDHPLVPGQPQEVVVSQTGHMTIRRLDVELHCVEQATYSPGTDTRVLHETVYRQSLLRREFLTLRAGSPFESRLTLCIPAGMMHSFVSDHNRVDWLVSVRVRSVRGGFTRLFPLCVYNRADRRAYAPTSVQQLPT